MKWKTVAIIFIVLFVVETAWISYGMYLITSEEKAINECYYNICEAYVDATYDEGICSCYEYDLLGDLVVGKTEYNP